MSTDLDIDLAALIALDFEPREVVRVTIYHWTRTFSHRSGVSEINIETTDGEVIELLWHCETPDSDQPDHRITLLAAMQLVESSGLDPVGTWETSHRERLGSACTLYSVDCLQQRT